MALWNWIQSSLGLQTPDITFGHMALRAIVVYGVLLVLLRIVGNRRFSGQHAAIDVVLSIILGATLSRAINGTAPFFGTLGVGFILIGLHRLLAAVTFQMPAVEKIIKGQPLILMRNGQTNSKTMRRGGISRREIASALRMRGQPVDFSRIAEASLETNGRIGLKTQKDAIRVLEVSVEPGVQTIRIQIED